MKNIYVFDHPLIQHKISMLRDAKTSTKDFRDLVNEVAMLMGYEVTRSMPLKEIEIETPLGMSKANIISGKKLGLIPILRAGLGMVEGMLNLLPMAKVGHLGLFRDPDSLKPVKYYCKLPDDIKERDAVILEPMLATGGTATEAVRLLKEEGIEVINIMCLIASKQGIETINKEHPDVQIYCAAVDEELNEQGYVIPGLGDAGDRLFGTK
jgi:uracil phosphoribosyltransferase